MKSMLVLTSILLAGGVAAYSSIPMQKQAPDPIKTSATNSNTNQTLSNAYRVHRVGVDGHCLLTRASDKIGAVAGEYCDDIYAPLAGVSGWNEESDGSIVLTDANGNSVVVLGFADGHAYESVIPASAMLIVERSKDQN